MKQYNFSEMVLQISETVQRNEQRIESFSWFGNKDKTVLLDCSDQRFVLRVVSLNQRIDSEDQRKDTSELTSDLMYQNSKMIPAN